MLITVNGVRVVLEDGTWGLVRASSNKPELVVVVESPVSEANMRAIFAELDATWRTIPRSAPITRRFRAPRFLICAYAPAVSLTGRAIPSA